MELYQYTEKLNKVDGVVYVWEEEAAVKDGVYEGELQHDNINPVTLSVHTGSKLTGDKLETYAVSTPSLTPWKRTIRIYSSEPVVYISYETEGDTVEAGDINSLQAGIAETQQALNVEVDRAGTAEQMLSEYLKEESQRAEDAEAGLSVGLSDEIERAKKAEQTVTDGLTAEVTRAESAERINAENTTLEIARAKDAEAALKSTVDTNKPKWDDKYTKNEVDNKFSTLETAIDWKESVSTYADIVKSYPSPQDGWTVNVKDTDYTYRYSGTGWIAISANAIPKATQGVDGILAKEDKTSYDDANTKKHTHSNKATVDKVTETLLTNWGDAYNKRHEHGNKGVLDTITQALLDNSVSAFMHSADVVRHITAPERTNWNTVTNKVDKVTGKQLSANDYTTEEKIKLTGVATGAEVNVQSDWGVADVTSDAFIKNKPASFPASDVKDWAKTDTKPSYVWSEIGSKPTTFAPSSHTHTKSQITDMPTKISQFTNDSGFITTSDIDTSQDHTHSNKTVLDKVTQALLDNWNTAFSHVGNKANPHGITAALVGLGNAENKNGVTIRSEMTKAEVVAALGYTPPTASPGYTHPSSGVTAGTYRNVTVNAQGHVTTGSNPTTLAGYGITDAAAKTHNHDTAYMKKGPVTWNNLKGV